MKKKKVIIIGAGPAGLTAGYQLLKKSNDYDVTIIEASNDIGGISKTVKYKDYRMDIGGHRFFSKSDEVMAFWNEIMPVEGNIPYDYKETGRTTKIMEGGPNPDQEDNVMLIRNRISRIFYLNHFFDYPISLKWQTFKNMGLIRTISSVLSYIKARIFKKKEDSLENFYINRFGKKLYSMFFENYTEKLWGRHPKEISADWGSQRVKGLSITIILKNMFMKLFHIKKKKVETSLIEEYYYPKYGPGHFWETVAKKIEKMGGKIIMKTPITDIKFKDDKIVSVSSKDQLFMGDYYISSMPIKDLVNGMSGNKEVSKDIKKIANGLPYRDFITIGCLVPKLKIKNETKIKTLGNIVPDCWIYIQDARVKLLRLQIFNNWSPYLLKNPKKEVWVGAEYTCQEGDKLWNMSAKEFSNFALEELETIGIIDKKSVIDYHVEKIKKAYPSYFDTYYEIDKVIAFLNKYDNLYCIGRNGQHRYNNMDHSMMTAFETVRNIMNNVKKKNNIWEVNTEKEYHEEKTKSE